MTWIFPYRNSVQQTLPLSPRVQFIACSAWDSIQRNPGREHSHSISENSMASKYFNFCILRGKIEFNLSKNLCSSADEIARVCAIRTNHAIKNNILRYRALDKWAQQKSSFQGKGLLNVFLRTHKWVSIQSG